MKYILSAVKLIIFLPLLIIASHPAALALDCPKMPEQNNKDWEVEVNAAVLKIGPVKGGELKTRTRNATKDLLGKLPQAGRIYLEQMMYSSYCSALRDDKTIKESEKAKLLKEYNREVRKAMTTSHNSVTKGAVKQEAKLESPTPKDPVKPAKPPTVDKPRKLETLLDLFKNDFNNLLRQNSDYILSLKCEDKCDELITIKEQAYLDFASQTVFVGFYIPSTTHTYNICVHLADNYNIALDLVTKQATIEFAMPGVQPVNSKELKFSGRVFIYNEYPVLEEQKRELYQLYKAKGLSLQFRDWRYVAEKNKEALTSGSSGSPKSPASGKP